MRQGDDETGGDHGISHDVVKLTDKTLHVEHSHK